MRTLCHQRLCEQKYPRHRQVWPGIATFCRDVEQRPITPRGSPGTRWGLLLFPLLAVHFYQGRGWRAWPCKRMLLSKLSKCAGRRGGGARRVLACLRSSAAVNSMAPQAVVVRSLPDSPNLSISLELAGKQRFMDRPKSESLAKTLGRIQLSAAAPDTKKQKRKKGQAPPMPSPQLPTVALYASRGDFEQAGDPLSGEAANEGSWQQGAVLRVGEEGLNVELNPPTVSAVSILGWHMVGYPLLASPTLLFADERETLYEWFYSKDAPTASRRSGHVTWQPLRSQGSRFFTPPEEAKGKLLRVECTPCRGSEGSRDRRQGEPLSSSTTTPVGEGPPLPAGHSRHLLTECPLRAPQLRVVSYNILADQYASTEYAKMVLFSNCPPQCLEAPYRRALILQEVLAFNADVVCLQEVDQRIFAPWLLPHMQQAGFEGFYSKKAGSVMEGSALFYRASRYKLSLQHSLTLRESLAPILGRGGVGKQPAGQATRKLHKELRPLVESNAKLRDALANVSTVAQLAVLTPLAPQGKDGPLCVLNTHLYFHPRANHIRAVHAAAILAAAEDVLEGATEVPLESSALLCFSAATSTATSTTACPVGAIELLQSGCVSASHPDWVEGAGFTFSKEALEEEKAEQLAASTGRASGETTRGNFSGSSEGEQWEEKALEGKAGEASVTGAELSTSFRLASADALQYAFTNYVKGYVGLLDFVWYEPERLRVVKAYELPGKEELAGFLPNCRFPSDHLSIIFDLEWREASLSRSKGGEEQESARGLRKVMTRVSGSNVEPLSSTGGDESEVRVVRVDGDGAVQEAASLLGRGEVIAVPTDTLYGLAASGSDTEAIQRIYAIKGRQSQVPVAICVEAVHNVSTYGETEHLPFGLLEHLLPGPVTVLLTRRLEAPLSSALNPGIPSLGIRVPASPFIRALCSEYGAALALTSANLSGAQSPLCKEDFESLWPELGAVFDGGRVGSGRDSRAGSTIVDLTLPGTFRVVRGGSAKEDTVAALVGQFGLQERNL